MTENLIDILLVEDSPDDIELTKEALEICKVEVKLHVTEDGVKAMRFLKKKEGYENVPTPDIVLLDLNLPRKDGREVLLEVKRDHKLKQIPVIVFTTSKHKKDVLSSYQNHANSYITKPVDFESFTHIIRTIENFWFNIVHLPQRNA